MRIGIDATWARTVGSGTASYTRGLVRALAAHTEHEFVLYFQSGDADTNPLFALPNVNVERRVVDGWGQLGRTLISLTRACSRDDLDLYHSPGYFLPLWSGPMVVTFHDANMFLQWDKWWKQGALKAWLALCSQSLLSARVARRVLPVSEAASRDIHRLLRVPYAKLTVLYQGIDDAFFEPLDGDTGRALRQARGLDDYLLFVSVISPIKNLEGLLHAYLQLERPTLKLAVVGREYGSYYRQVVRPLITRLGLENRVEVLGTVDDQTLRALYAGARALIYPSFSEGFGLPPLEAMACGTPVVASNRASLPEILGNAALLVDPVDTDGIAAAVDAILSNEDLRQDLVQRGGQRANRFRWSVSAWNALQIYRDVAQMEGSRPSP